MSEITVVKSAAAINVTLLWSIGNYTYPVYGPLVDRISSIAGKISSEIIGGTGPENS